MKKIDDIIDEPAGAGPDDTPKALAKAQPKELQRALGAVDIAERIDAEQLARKRTEALTMGRAIALAGLPYKRTKERQLSRTIRVGRDTWVSITYRAIDDAPLPYGEDRYVLAGIQHLALERGSPFVSFEEAGELLRLFDIERSGVQYQRLRARLKRIRGLNIAIKTHTKGHPVDHGWDAQILSAHLLPTRRQMIAQAKDENEGQLALPGTNPYFVKVGADWWQYLQAGGRNLLLVRLDLLRQFITRPRGWDYLCFLAHRCGSAQTESIIPHDVLIGLFRQSKSESERKTIARLRGYHEEIMTATDGKLVASLEVVGEERGRGRPKKLWGLRVGPSDPLIASGKNVLELPLEAED